MISVFPTTSSIWSKVFKPPQYGTTVEGIADSVINYFGLKLGLQEVIRFTCKFSLQDVKKDNGSY